MYSLGIDFGTSGARAVVMDAQQRLIAEVQCPLPASQSSIDKEHSWCAYWQQPVDWWQAFVKLITQLKSIFAKNKLNFEHISHLAIDGTSGTVLLTDNNGQPVSQALMYNDQRAQSQAQLILQKANQNTAAMGASSGLAKFLWLYQKASNTSTIAHVVHQSDWLSGRLLGRQGISDHNNALKMGYDAEQQCWPQWLLELLENLNIDAALLPRVVIPGSVIANISTRMAHQLGFNPELKICAGTTDSTAAIMASGASEVGHGITSLGSTLVMKVISAQPVFDQASGVYSQPYGQYWLVGGASNSGGAVLKHYFDNTRLQQLTHLLDECSGRADFSCLDLNYYPLITPGERFPIQDSAFTGRLSPKPEQTIDFFQALLEGMADIEAQAYKKLLDLGAPYPNVVRSMGGGAVNKSWAYIRQLKLGSEVINARHQQAAVGSALLAQSSW